MSAPVDLPRVPRPRRSRFVVVVAVLGLGAVGAAAGLAALGRDGHHAERDRFDGSVRASPGGYRSFHFWHSGYTGGK
jgi:hypothetical protein